MNQNLNNEVAEVTETRHDITVFASDAIAICKIVRNLAVVYEFLGFKADRIICKFHAVTDDQAEYIRTAFYDYCI